MKPPSPIPKRKSNKPKTIFDKVVKIFKEVKPTFSKVMTISTKVIAIFDKAERNFSKAGPIFKKPDPTEVKVTPNGLILRKSCGPDRPASFTKALKGPARLPCATGSAFQVKEWSLEANRMTVFFGKDRRFLAPQRQIIFLSAQKRRLRFLRCILTK